MSYILKWSVPHAGLPRYNTLGSDTSPMNLFLLSEKYNIEISENDGILFRHYNGTKQNRQGYRFPLSFTQLDMAKILKILKNDARERGEALRFCLCNEKQKNILDAFCRVKWESWDGDGDYIQPRKFEPTFGEKVSQKEKSCQPLF